MNEAVEKSLFAINLSPIIPLYNLFFTRNRAKWFDYANL